MFLSERRRLIGVHDDISSAALGARGKPDALRERLEELEKLL
jgi:hypothetical protein